MNTITVEQRENATARRLRRSGRVPCVIYGRGLEASLSVQMDEADAQRLLRTCRIGSRLQLALDGRIYPVQVKDVSAEPVSAALQHISFQALREDEMVNSMTHILLKNQDKAMGILEKLCLEVPYASLPGDMIDTVTVDAETLPVGAVLAVGDLPAFQTDRVALQIDRETVVLRISERKRVSAGADRE